MRLARAWRTRNSLLVAGVGTLFLLGASKPAASAVVLVAEGENTLHDAVARANPGDTLRLTPGLYVVTHTVLIDKDLTIEGSTKHPEDVHIVAVDADEFDFETGRFANPLDWGHILFVTGGARKAAFRYFTIKNAPEVEAIDELTCEGVFQLNHTECFGDGIHADGAADVVVEDLEASLNAGNGIYVDGAQKAAFRNIRAVNNGAFGIDVDTALHLSILNSTFIGNQISGVEASGHEKGVPRSNYTADVVIEHTVADGNGEIGIEVERFATATMQEVICSNNREDGFDADRVGQVTISKSSFVNNLDDAMELFPVDVADPNEQPVDFPGSIVENFRRLTFSGNVGEDINHPPTEN